MKKKLEIPDVSILNELFEYSEGILIHKSRSRKWFCSDAQQVIWHKRWFGKEAGKINTSGHVQIAIGCKHYLAHRIVWAMFNNGIDTDIEIDHIDENKENNRIENLRIAIDCGNSHNISLRKDNTTGIKGVHWDSTNKKWKSEISLRGKKKCGYFNDISSAEQWVVKERLELHGKFANNGTGCVYGTN